MFVLAKVSDLLFKVNIEIDQVQKSFDCKSDQTVLEAAADANIELPSSCLVGMCCTCAAFLKEGLVDICLLYTSPSPRD